MQRVIIPLLLMFGTFVPAAAGDKPVDKDGRPLIKKLGVIDWHLVEATPIVFKNRVYRFEWVRAGYPENQLKANYFRLIDHQTGKSVTKPFAKGYVFGSAFVDNDTIYVTGTSSEKGANGQRVRIFSSKDMKSWEEWDALDLDGYSIFNTSICKTADDYVLMFEIGAPKAEAGVGFTARFARSKDLKTWKLTPPECVYSKDRYTAPHCLRYLDGWYYNFFLEAHEGFEMRVVRSRDLVTWSPSPLNPVLRHSKEDKKLYNKNLTKEQRALVAKANNRNNSDIDFCQFKGRLVISYSWGDQVGTEFLNEALYEGSEADFLRGWFPDDKSR